MDIEVTCNTDDAVLYANIAENSRKISRWIGMSDPHDGHAVIVGSGPSVKSTLETIRWRAKEGQVIFALNNAANWLESQGIRADYQVLMDARLETVSLIGPARQHLLCSQVHPDMLDELPEAWLFHPCMPDIEKHLPDHDARYALIGGGTTVGLSTMCLAFAMGYRKIHLFGFDSCNEQGSSHVLPQAINNGEPMATFEWNGKNYVGSLTMIRQAELFQPVCNNLVDMGCTITVDGYGLIPDIVRHGASIEMSEKEKYQKMWRFEEYRQVAPGEHVVERFLKVAKPREGDKVIDFGCGTGRAALKLAEAGLQPTLIDFVPHCRDPEAMHLPFIEADLHDLPDIYREWGFCTDVLEHIETERLESLITGLMKHVKGCFFQISLVPDHAGALIDQLLHLTVKPFQWWIDLFCHLGFAIRHAKDDGHSATFLITR